MAWCHGSERIWALCQKEEGEEGQERQEGEEEEVGCKLTQKNIVIFVLCIYHVVRNI